MYLPTHFEESRIEVLHNLMQQQDMATLTSFDGVGLQADHLPFELDVKAGPFGTLRAHVARANPLLQQRAQQAEALVIFQGAQAYISPSWYPSKQLDGKVVPTYNYIVVHAYGPLRLIDDRIWLRGLVERLTQRHEAAHHSVGKQPWRIDDAPADYIEKMLGAIVGIEIPVTRLIGKWKVSQNHSAANRAGVIEGLQQAGAAAAMIEAVNRQR